VSRRNRFIQGTPYWYQTRDDNAGFRKPIPPAAPKPSNDSSKSAEDAMNDKIRNGGPLK
jgi:hypothetical protein